MRSRERFSAKDIDIQLVICFKLT